MPIMNSDQYIFSFNVEFVFQQFGSLFIYLFFIPTNSKFNNYLFSIASTLTYKQFGMAIYVQNLIFRYDSKPLTFKF